MASPPRVCVVGGGGFVASWLVKLLLSRGYAVHATVRDPSDPKNACLKQMDGASENLHLFKADVLDVDTLTSAFAGCEGVFHPATPVPGGKIVDPENEIMVPTVKGTKNVLDACSATNVRKLIVVSSVAASCFDPNWPEGKLKDESCWTDKQLCKEAQNWYSLAKTEAEDIALEYGKKSGLHVVSICPGLVVGPLLQHVTVNTSSKVLLYIIKGGPDTLTNKFWPLVDVRDVNEAMLLVYEKAESSGRYICSLDQMDIKDIVALMRSIFPNYNYADKMVDVDYNVYTTSEKLKNLGWQPRKLEETLTDSIEYFEMVGLLKDDADGNHADFPIFTV
nr:unnamed protein product [Digitaria exilis]